MSFCRLGRSEVLTKLTFLAFIEMRGQCPRLDLVSTPRGNTKAQLLVCCSLCVSAFALCNSCQKHTETIITRIEGNPCIFPTRDDQTHCCKITPCLRLKRRGCSGTRGEELRFRPWKQISDQIFLARSRFNHRDHVIARARRGPGRIVTSGWPGTA